MTICEIIIEHGRAEKCGMHADFKNVVISNIYEPLYHNGWEQHPQLCRIYLRLMNSHNLLWIEMGVLTQCLQKYFSKRRGGNLLSFLKNPKVVERFSKNEVW